MTIYHLGYNIRITPFTDAEGGSYLAKFPDLPGCMSDRASEEEAIRNAYEALLSYLATAAKYADTIALPNIPASE